MFGACGITRIISFLGMTFWMLRRFCIWLKPSHGHGFSANLRTFTSPYLISEDNLLCVCREEGNGVFMFLSEGSNWSCLYRFWGHSKCMQNWLGRIDIWRDTCFSFACCLENLGEQGLFWPVLTSSLVLGWPLLLDGYHLYPFFYLY